MGFVVSPIAGNLNIRVPPAIRSFCAVPQKTSQCRPSTFLFQQRLQTAYARPKMHGYNWQRCPLPTLISRCWSSGWSISAQRLTLHTSWRKLVLEALTIHRVQTVYPHIYQDVDILRIDTDRMAASQVSRFPLSVVRTPRKRHLIYLLRVQSLSSWSVMRSIAEADAACRKVPCRPSESQPADCPGILCNADLVIKAMGSSRTNSRIFWRLGRIVEFWGDLPSGARYKLQILNHHLHPRTSFERCASRTQVLIHPEAIWWSDVSTLEVDSLRT